MPGPKLACYALCWLSMGVAGNLESSFPGESIRLGVLLPMSGSWHSGRTIAGAASLAVKRINRDASLLGGKTVEYVLLDGGCNATQGLKVAMSLLEDARIGAIIGPGALPIWCGVLQLCPVSESTQLSQFSRAQGAMSHAKPRCVSPLTRAAPELRDA